MRGKVDPLPPGKLQQQVKRAFETIEIDSESRFARGLDKVKVDSKRVRSGHKSPPRRMLTDRRGAGKGRRQGVNSPTIAPRSRFTCARLKYMVHTQRIFVCISTKVLADHSVT